MSGSEDDLEYYFEATVLDDSQEPVEGATVTVEGDSGAADVTWGDGSNETDADGVVGGVLANGEYTATAEYEDDSGETVTGSTDFTIDGEEVEFDIVLGQDDTSGETGDGTDGSDGSQQEFTGASGETDAEGIFTFSAPDGTYLVSVDHPDEDAVTEGEVTVSGSGLDIQVELGGDVTVSGGDSGDGDDGTDSGDVTLTVNTLEATEVTASSATLNGEVTELEGAEEVSVHFEWVSSGGSFPETTSGQTLDAAGEFSAELTDLDADTQYDFRAVAEAGGASDTGSEMSLTTGTESS